MPRLLRRPLSAPHLTQHRARWRRSVLAGLTATALLSVGLGAPAARADTDVFFPDAALGACVRSALGLGMSDPVTASEMQGLIELSCAGMGIADLTGLETATGLVELDLSSNAITDLSPIAPDGALATLAIGRNQVSDLAPVASLGGLSTLVANDNLVSDLGPLSMLTSLSSVSVDHNRVSDLSPLQWLPLTQLDAADQTITPAQAATVGVPDPLPAVTDLDGSTAPLTVVAGQGTIVDDDVYWAAPGGAALGWNLPDTGPFGTSVFSGVVQVEVNASQSPQVTGMDPRLVICMNEALHLPPANTLTQEQLAGVTQLSCTNAGVTSLAGIGGAPNLTTLELDGNALTSVQPIVTLSQLTTFSAQGQEVTLPHATVGLPATLPMIGTPAPQPNQLTIVHGSGDVAGTLSADSTSVVWAEPGTGQVAWDHVVQVGQAVGHFSGTLTQPVDAPVSPPVTVPDANLLGCLQSTLGLDADQPVTVAQLQGLASLTCSSDSISDLAGLEDATNLTALNLENNTISDLSPLSGLGSLTDLDLGYNEIADLTPIAGLTALTTLDIRDNRVTDITPVTSITTLQNLTANDQYLFLQPPYATVGMPYTLPASLVGHLQLPSPSDGRFTADGVIWAAAGEFHLSWNMAPAGGGTFSGMLDQVVEEPQTARVDVPDPDLAACLRAKIGIADTEQIATEQMQRLTQLSCSGAGISDLTGLGAATSLTTLDLSDNVIADVGPLAGLTALSTLDLSHNAIADVGPLAGLTALTTLDLSHNAIANVGPLAGISSLYDLDVTGQSVTLPDATVGVPSPLPVVYATGDITVTIADGDGTLSQNGQRVTWRTPGVSTVTWDGVVYLTSHPAAADYSGTFTQTVRPSPVVDVPDGALLGCLVDAVGAPAGSPVTQAQLAALTSLTCDDAGVRDLTGLEAATGLTQLSLRGDQVTDLSVLGSLPALTTFDASGQQLSLPDADVGDAVPLPVITGLDGSSVPLAVGAGDGTLADGAVTWTAPGASTLTWSATASGGSGPAGTFSGTVTQSVDAVAAPPGPTPARVSLSRPVFSGKKQVSHAVKKRRVSVSTRVSGTATGVVTFREGSVALGSAQIHGGTASLLLPAKLSLGKHHVTAFIAATATASAATSPTSGVVKVVKAKVKKLKVKAKKRFKPHHKVKLKVKVAKRLTNGHKAKGKVTVKVGKKTVAKVGLKKLRKHHGKVVIKKRFVKGKKLKVKATFTPKHHGYVKKKKAKLTLKRKH